jgi:hypothetical protein
MNNDRFEALREWGIAILSLTLVVFGLVMVWRVFSAAGQKGRDKDEDEKIIAAYNRQKDTMEATGMIFLTTVLGYYFGRVPAAKAAKDAQKQAAGAQRVSEELRQVLLATERALLAHPGDTDEARKTIARALNK